MIALFETTSSLLIAFTNTLIHSLWIGAILYVVLKVLFLCTNDRRSALRYWASSLSLGMFLLLAAGLFSYLYQPSSPASAASSASSISFLYVFALAPEQLPTDATALTSIYPILWKVYLLGLGILSMRWLISAIKIRSVIHTGTPATDREVNMLRNLKSRLGIRTGIRLLVSEKLRSPVLYGFIKPVIIVPAGMFFNLSNEQVESILLHELIHVKRLDFLVNFLQSVMEIIFFFNPFIWLISSMVRSERENRCDDRVLLSGSSPGVYAKALLNLSLLRSGKFDMALYATGSNRNQLLNRIQRIINTETMKTRNRQKALLSYLVIVGLIVIIVSSGFSSSLFTVEKQNNDAILPEAEVESSMEDGLSPAPDTIDLQAADTMTEEEWQQYKAEMEHSIQEMKNIDWQKEQVQFEQQQEQALADLQIDKEQFAADMEKLREELSSIDRELIMLEIEKARLHMDSIKENFDEEKLEQEIEKAMQEIQITIEELEIKLQDREQLSEDVQYALQQSLIALKEINLEEIMENVQLAIEDLDIDFDHDFDFDFDHDIDINFDSIMEEVRINMQEIDFEVIRQNIEEAIQKMEYEMQVMEEHRKAKKEEK